MVVWMYYATDGDSGYYDIRLFSTREKAEAYKKIKNDSYGRIKEVQVQ